MLINASPVNLVLPVGAPRTPGVHLSGLIRGIAIEGGILKPELEEDHSIIERDGDSELWWATLPDYAKGRIAMGLAWERWYIQTQLPEVADHPGEMCRDGVYMTPDGEELTVLYLQLKPRYGIRLHEIKLTYKSINTIAQTSRRTETWLERHSRPYDSSTDPIGLMTTQWMWMAQAKGYCKGAGTRFCTFHVLFVAGDYDRPIRPLCWRYDIEFTQDEIDTSWDLMIDYRDHQLYKLEQL